MNVLGVHVGHGSNVTEALGWWHGDGEGKTMGLAPYGDYTRCQGVLDKFYPKFGNGEVTEHHDFGRLSTIPGYCSPRSSYWARLRVVSLDEYQLDVHQNERSNIYDR